MQRIRPYQPIKTLNLLWNINFCHWPGFNKYSMAIVRFQVYCGQMNTLSKLMNPVEKYKFLLLLPQRLFIGNLEKMLLFFDIIYEWLFLLISWLCLEFLFGARFIINFLLFASRIFHKTSPHLLKIFLFSYCFYSATNIYRFQTHFCCLQRWTTRSLRSFVPNIINILKES